MRVVVITDESNRLGHFFAALVRRGIDVSRLTPPRLAPAVLKQAHVALVRPGGVGVDGDVLCRSIRELCDIPIIMIAHRPGSLDNLLGLRAGADDFIVEPCDLEELLARIHAVVARRDRATGPGTLRIGDLLLDFADLTVAIGDANIDLTRKEFKLLALLAAESGAVCSRERLATEVWGSWSPANYASLQVVISRLRAKLGNKHITTVRGCGYRLTHPRRVNTPARR